MRTRNKELLKLMDDIKKKLESRKLDDNYERSFRNLTYGLKDHEKVMIECLWKNMEDEFLELYNILKDKLRRTFIDRAISDSVVMRRDKISLRLFLDNIRYLPRNISMLPNDLIVSVIDEKMKNDKDDPYIVSGELVKHIIYEIKHTYLKPSVFRPILRHIVFNHLDNMLFMLWNLESIVYDRIRDSIYFALAVRMMGNIEGVATYATGYRPISEYLFCEQFTL